MVNVTQPVNIWERMAEMSLDMLCTLDQNGCYTHVSKACEHILGYRQEELEGLHYTKILLPEDLLATQEALRDVRNGINVTNFENCLLHKNGLPVPILWSVTWSEEDQVFFCVARNILERKQNRLTLENSEQRYKALFANNPDIIFTENKAGFVTEVNQSFYATLGHVIKGEASFTFSSILPPEMKAVHQDALQRACTGAMVRFQLDLITSHKEHRHYEVVKHPVIVKGEVVEVQTIAKDITSLVHSHETIQQQATQLNTVFESITDAFVTLDQDWKIIFVNSQAERLVGFDKEHLLGRSIWEVFPKHLYGDYYKHYQQALDTGQSVHFEAYFKASASWFEVKAYPSAKGLSVYFNDITERVKAREELEKLSLVASKTTNGVIIANKEWKIEWVNEGFSNLMGYGLEETIGRQPSDILKSRQIDKNAFALLEHKLLLGEPIAFEEQALKKDGEEVWFSTKITALFNAEEALSGFVEVQTDITALKKSELELSSLATDLYKQNSDLQQFAYIVSHNLRSPVANALGLTYLLTTTKNDAVLHEKTLAHLNQSMLQLDGVLKDMNTILTIRDTKGNAALEKVNLRIIFEQALLSLQEPLLQIGSEFKNELAEDLTIQANKAYLYSIFHNLLSNAIKYRAEDRILKVKVKSYSNAKNGILISFLDNGSGFDMQKAGSNVFKLYKRFHRNKEGSGIGLYLIKTHIEAMGGHIEVNSRVDAGTKFLLYLPTGK